MTSGPSHRDDIDGLRAVAVLGVLLFHFGATWLPGGFSGVDVFFVISGYVITLKLRREIESDDFTLLGFYDGRVRRILPAALATTLASLIAGYFLLWPGDYESLGASATYAAAGLANLFFFWNTSYFDQEASLQPLLHFWSLGVEEQFYVVWPVLLWFAMWATRSQPRLLLPILGIATALAFICAESWVGYDPKSAFYLPQFRAWELSLGALLAFVPVASGRLLSVAMSVFGAGLIGYSFLVIQESNPFPGLNAAYACVGTALLIWPKAKTNISRLLSTTLAVFIGKISYSLYLWHWPVWVFYRHYNNGAPASLLEALGLGVLTFTLAVLSWRFIEQPFRRPLGNRWKVVGSGVAAVAVIAVLGNLVVSSAGFMSRTSEATEPLASLSAMWHWECPTKVTLPAIGENCAFGADWTSAKEKVLLWGDSHAEHMAPLLQVYAAQHDAAVVLFRACSPAFDGKSFIPSHFEYPDYDIACANTYDAVMSLVKENGAVSKVVLASSWSSVADTIVGSNRKDVESRAAGVRMLRDAVTQTAKQITAVGVKVALVATVPSWPSDPIPCAVNEASSLVRKPCLPTERGISVADFEERQADEYQALEAAAKIANAAIIEPGLALCSEGSDCITWLDGEFLYRDVSHLRRNLQPDTMVQLAGLLGIERLFTH